MSLPLNVSRKKSGMGGREEKVGPILIPSMKPSDRWKDRWQGASPVLAPPWEGGLGKGEYRISSCPHPSKFAGCLINLKQGSIKCR